VRGRLPDAWRLSVGTLTAIPVKAPTRVDRDTAGLAMVLAPVAVLPLAIPVTLVLWGGRSLGLNPLIIGLLGVGVLALGSRAFHLDGLADTADALTASYDRARSLEVMKSGSAGPAGVVALIVVLGVQAVGMAVVVTSGTGLALAGALVCFSRVALTITCARGVPAARPDGLGASTAHSVPRPVAAMSWIAAAVASAAIVSYTGGPWWEMMIGFAVAAGVVCLLVRRAIRRLGGVTGDIYGAAIEITLAVLLVSATV
jgi:adenosylcobinamide-GDP ribazoletransferase